MAEKPGHRIGQPDNPDRKDQGRKQVGGKGCCQMGTGYLFFFFLRRAKAEIEHHVSHL